MTNTGLTQALFSQLQGEPTEQLSRQLGTSPDQTATAISAALPLLMGALGRNATQPQGADALLGALQRDHAQGDLGSVLGSVLGGGGQGAGILGHLFGGAEPKAAQGLGQATRLGGAQAAQLLAMLAPIVLSFLAKRASQQQFDAGGLSQALGQENRALEQQAGLGSGQLGGLLGGVLDQDGDGQVGLGDLLKIGGGLFGGKR